MSFVNRKSFKHGQPKENLKIEKTLKEEMQKDSDEFQWTKNESVKSSFFKKNFKEMEIEF